MLRFLINFRSHDLRPCTLNSLRGGALYGAGCSGQGGGAESDLRVDVNVMCVYINW